MKTDGGLRSHPACPMAQSRKRPCWDHRGGGGDSHGTLKRAAIIVFYRQQNSLWALEKEAQPISIPPPRLIIANKCVTLSVTF